MSLNSIKDRQWSIMACSSQSKEGCLSLFMLIFTKDRFSRGYGMAFKQNKEINIRVQ